MFAHRIRPVGPFSATLVVVIIVLLSSKADAEFDPGAWRRFCDIRVPSNQPEGLVGVPIDSGILENCRPDRRDLRVVSLDGPQVPSAFTDVTGGSGNEPFPARVLKVTRVPGKWTDILVDKTAKVLSRGTLIETTSKEFVRKVEVRGSDNGRESYVLRMDGLIADLSSPHPVTSLSVFYPVCNFQYIHIRVIDEDRPPLKISGVACHPPDPETPLVKTVEARITENRRDQSGNSTITVVDLGEKRFPVVSLGITTSAAEFVKKVRFRGGSSPSPESWRTLFDGIFYRIKKDEACGENLSATVKPQTCRYVSMELTGGSALVPVDRVTATVSIPMMVFEYRRGGNYRLLYDNPSAAPPGRETPPSAINAVQVASFSTDVRLGPPQKNPTPQSQPKVVPRMEESSGFSLRRVAGMSLLLLGLLLLFSLMLKARRAGKAGRFRETGRYRTMI